LHNHTLEHGQIFHRADVVQAEMVARADVGDHRHLATVKGQPFAQHAPTGGFKHGGIDIGMHQDAARTARSAAVAGVKLQAVDIHPICVGHADTQATGFEQMGTQANRGGFAVCACHGNHWNAAILTRGEHRINDGATHIPAFAE